MKYLIILCLLLQGCAFYGDMTLPDGKKIKWNASKPCIIKKGDIEIDGKGEPLIKLGLPDISAAKL